MTTSHWPEPANNSAPLRGRAVASTGVTLLLIVTLVLAASPAMARTCGLELLGQRDATFSRLSTWEQVRTSEPGGDNDQDPRRNRPGLGEHIRIARAELTALGVLARLLPTDTQRDPVASATPRPSLLNLPPPTLA
ncbi:MAG: hypothetical protein K2W85_10470 [Phycisphaerales bacterium]|nr:hypothetical protein [Phycisphaerales bacterium]